LAICSVCGSIQEHFGNGPDLIVLDNHRSCLGKEVTMQPVVSDFTLAHLAQALTRALTQTAEGPTNLAVKCAVSRGKLMILLEHADDLTADAVFAQVEQGVRQQLTTAGLPQEAVALSTQADAIPVKLYLKRQNQGTPWAVHHFDWQLGDSFTAVFGDKPLDASDPEAFEPLLPDSGPAVPGPEASEDWESPEIESEMETVSQASEDVELELPPDLDLPDQAEAMDDMPEVATVEPPEDPLPQPRWARLRLGVAAGLGAILLGGLGYVVTRPCTVGSCDRISRAEAAGEAAQMALSDRPSPQTVLEMRDQLQGVVRQLRPIPPWSPHYADAQQRLQGYEQKLQDLNRVIAAQQVANQAVAAGQSPPHTVSHWQGVATDWQTAIDQLNEITPDRSLYSTLVEPKLKEYQVNLATIESRIDAEQRADSSVNQAQQVAAMATQQMKQASTLSAWETTLTNWETAVTQLQQVPQGTLAYGEAQKLLSDYQAELSQVRTRTRQERVAEQFYTEAAASAATARQHASENQWTLALMNWRNAVTQIQGVPSGTVRFQESQTLLKTYQAALSQAQENLRLAMLFQKVEPSIAQACAPGLCRYAMQNGKVRLDLAEGYGELVELSITPPPQRVAPRVSNQMINQANQLLEAVTTIGKQNQLPIELYDAQGSFIARYQPDLDGYVKR
jgi:hypothetical protein